MNPFRWILHVSFITMMLCLAPTRATAGEVSGISYDDPWRGITTYGNDVTFSKDNNVKHKTGYSLKIQNSDYADSQFRKTIPVEKNTDYKISAMARYSGYKRKPDDIGAGGANISVWGEWTLSELHTGAAWKKIELDFNS